MTIMGAMNADLFVATTGPDRMARSLEGKSMIEKAPK